MDPLIVKAQEMLNFLREHTQEGVIEMNIKKVSPVKALVVKLCGDWFYVVVYDADGEVWSEKSLEVYEGIK